MGISGLNYNDVLQNVANLHPEGSPSPLPPLLSSITSGGGGGGGASGAYLLPYLPNSPREMYYFLSTLCLASFSRRNVKRKKREKEIMQEARKVEAGTEAGAAICIFSGFFCAPRRYIKYGKRNGGAFFFFFSPHERLEIMRGAPEKAGTKIKKRFERKVILLASSWLQQDSVF